MAFSVESVPLVSQSIENRVSWNDLRNLIADCPELPADARGQMIELGDAVNTQVGKG